MGLPDLYPAQVGSPYTTLAAPYTTGAATMTVADATKLPDAPNIVCLAGAVAGEFTYSGKDGNILQGLAALPGTPAATTWPAGTFAFRGISAYDLDALREYARRTVSDPKLYTTLREIVANRDLVECAGYPSIDTEGAVNWGSVAVSERHYLSLQHTQRVRQNGDITRVQIYLDSVPAALTAFYFNVWRKNAAGTYDRVGQEDLLSSLDAGMNTVDLATPIAAHEGDFVGYGFTASAPPGLFMVARTDGHNDATRLVNSAPTETAFDWDAQETGAGTYITTKLFCSAPLVVAIGDSIMSGKIDHRSFLESYTTTSIRSQISVWLADQLNCTIQNMGISSQNTTQIAARFSTDVVALHPKIAVIEGGVNDLAVGSTQATFIANWTSMLDACAAAGIIPVCLAILPWTNGTNENMQARDTWNAALRDLVMQYDGAVWVDTSAYIGQFRAGGDDNNLWDIQSAYTVDGVHFTVIGYAQIARAIADAIGREYGGIANEIRILPTTYVADISFGGDVLDGQIAGEAFALLDVVYLKSDGKWWKTDADAEATSAGLLGIAMRAASGGELQILIRGTIRNDAWAWTVGGSLYLSTDAGALTQTAPSDPGDVTRLAGVAYSTDVIVFAPDLHYSVVT